MVGAMTPKDALCGAIFRIANAQKVPDPNCVQAAILGPLIFMLLTVALQASVLAQTGTVSTPVGMNPATKGSPSTLDEVDPGLAKALSEFGPIFSQSIPHTSGEVQAPGDFVEKFLAADGSQIRVLVKTPAPTRPGKILEVPPIAKGQPANDYFNNALKEAISGGYAAVVFPSGTYNFVTPPAKQSHVMIQGAKDLTIDGQGSTLNFASPLTGGVSISNSQRVIFKGFSIDWPNELMASVATIVSVDKPHKTMRLKIAPQYKVDASTPIFALSPWDAKSDLGNPHFSLTAFYKEQYDSNTRAVYLGNNTFEVPYWNNYIAAGDVMLVRHWGGSPWRSAIESRGSFDLSFEDVNIYASPYMGFVLSGGGGYRLSHCSVTRLNPARLISTTADGVHIADSSGDIIIENSTFAYQGDDGINIHGALGMFDQEPDQSLHWKAGGESTWAPYGWVPNTDVIGFFSGTVGFLGTTSLTSLSHPKIGLSINLKKNAPQTATEMVDLSRVGARFVIRNNQFLFNRPRGILLETSLGLVENNFFTGQTAHGIVVGVWPGGEGPGVQNVVFRGNRFTNVGSFPPQAIPDQDVHLGALVVAVQDGPENVSSMIPVFESLIFDSNTFTNLQGPGLYLSRANAVTIINSQFQNTNLSPANASLSATGLNGAIVINHSHNVSLQGNTMYHAGAIWIDPKSTAGISQASRR